MYTLYNFSLYDDIVQYSYNCGSITFAPQGKVSLFVKCAALLGEWGTLITVSFISSVTRTMRQFI